MKKMNGYNLINFYGILILLIIYLIVFIPNIIGEKYSDGIHNYYMDFNIMDNGDVEVKELYYLNGKYNGYEEDVAFINEEYQKPFDDSINSLKGSSIYNGDNIETIDVRAVPKKTFPSYKIINNPMGESMLNETSKYNAQIIKDKHSYSYRMFNNDKGFYLDYIIKNMSVKHNDISELATNILTGINENINSLEIHIHVPNNKDYLKTWVHGMAYGKMSKIDNQNMIIKMNKIVKNQKLDMRVVFDKDAINTDKQSGYDELNNIENLENTLQVGNKQESNTFDKVMIIMNVSIGIIIFCLICIVIKNKKEEKNIPYYREIPDGITPTEAGYLYNQSADASEFYAGIMDLVNRGAIELEPMPGMDDYKIVYKEKVGGLTKEQVRILSCVMQGEDATLKTLGELAHYNSSPFVRAYTYWHNETLEENRQKFKFVNCSSMTPLLILILAPIIFDISFNAINSNNVLLIIMFILLMITLLFYFNNCKQYNLDSNIKEDVYKVIGLRNYMKDFTILDEKELPEVHLWSKYLIYAVALGCTEEVSSTFKKYIGKLKLYDDPNFVDGFTRLSYMNYIYKDSFPHGSIKLFHDQTFGGSSGSSGDSFGGFSDGGFGSSGDAGSFGGGRSGGRF